MQITIGCDRSSNTVVEVGNEHKVTLSFADRNMLQKLKSFIQSLPEKIENREEALDLVSLYLKSETLQEEEGN